MNLVGEERALKQKPGPDIIILGSGSLVSQLTAARLIDLYQLVLVPVVLGKGRTLFGTLSERQASSAATAAPSRTAIS